MTLDYFFFYMESNIVCIVVLAILLINDKLHSSQQEKQIWFNRTIVAHILYLTSDIFWAAVLSGQLPCWHMNGLCTWPCQRTCRCGKAGGKGFCGFFRCLFPLLS